MNTDLHVSQGPRSLLSAFLAMLGICLVIMLIAIDQTVVGTALPRIVAELQGFDLYAWIASAYLMTSAVMVPITGRLGDLYGRKYFVLTSIVIFSLASALCGMAQNMLQLVIFRGFQGVGGGMLVGVAFASVPDLFPDRIRRIRWQAMLSATFGISTALGPALGGWLTEHVGWRSVFYVNLPIALVALPVVARFLPRIVHHTEGERALDWLGGVLLAGAVWALLLATEYGPSHGFRNWRFGGLLVTMMVLGWGFFRHQRHSSAPIIPARVFLNRDVLKLASLSVLTGLTLFVLVFYAPLLLQGGFRLSPHTAGVTITPLLVCITVGSIINGRLLPSLPRPERLIFMGLVLLFAATVLLSGVSQGTKQGWLMAIFGACGLAMGFQLPNLTLQMQAVVARVDLGIASALVQTCRMLGSMLGASLGGLVVNLGYSRHIAQALASAGLHDPEITALLRSPQLLVRLADQEALAVRAKMLGVNVDVLLGHARDGLVSGIHHAFLVCCVIVLISMVVSWYLPAFVLHEPARSAAPGK